MSHNGALARIDLSRHGHAIAADAEIPPEDPENGECWILGDAPEDDWTGQGGEIAGWTEGGWRFLDPCEGMRYWLSEIEGFAMFSQGLWTLGDVHGCVIMAGRQVVGGRGEAIAELSGGMVVDAEARASILAVLVAMREHEFVDTD